MKNDSKVFSIYILIIVAYALLHFFDGVGFVFSSKHSDFGLGIISLGLFFSKKLTKYSFVLVSFGFSLFYIVADTEGFDLIHRTGFLQLRILSLVIFSFMVLWDLYKRRYQSLKFELGILALLLLIFYSLQAVDLDFAFTQDFSIYKSGIGFLLVVWMLQKNSLKNSFSTPLKRVIIVVGLSFFIEAMSYFVLNM